MAKVLLAFLVAGTAILFAAPEKDAGAFCNGLLIAGGQIACDGGGHPRITQEGLSFLWPGIRDEVQDWNVNQDSRDGELPEHHFDNCRFQEGTSYIRARYDDMIAALDPQSPNTAEAIKQWGQLMHGVQDFYSHTPWVDPEPIGMGFGTGQGRFFDGGLGNWSLVGAPYTVHLDDSLPDDVVVVEGDPPEGVSVDFPRDANGDPTSAVPIVTTTVNGEAVTYRGFISDTSQSGLDAGLNRCPAGAQIRHGNADDDTFDPFDDHCTGEIYENCLHHDDDSRPRFTQAFNAAVVQTQHEWCRLLHMLRDRYGFEGSSIPMGLWVQRDQPGNSPPDTPHPFGTACQRETSHAVKGPIAVSVSVPSMEQILDFEVLGYSLPLVSSFVAHSGDFRSSTRTRSDRISFGDSPRTGVVDPLTLCLDASDTLAVTLQGWGDIPLDFPLSPFNAGIYDFPFEPAFKGLTLSFPGPGFGAGSHTRSSDHVSAAFDVSLPTSDSDEDGLPDLCAEPFYGTVVGNRDSDDDGLLDGDEVNFFGTDPANPDHDGDGLEDGTEVNGTNPTNPLDRDTDHDGLLDGEEDANQNGALDAGETNPNDADSDNDGLLDGTEVNGTNPTDPLDSDSDNDGLLDGEEDANHNGALDPGETNPKDADSDDDTLLDGVEVRFGTDPLDSDSDNDGVPDGEDVEWLQNAITSLPVDAFNDSDSGLRTAMVVRLGGVDELVAQGKVSQALSILSDLRRRVDGCGARPDRTDWIVICARQVEIRAFLDLLATNIRT